MRSFILRRPDVDTAETINAQLGNHGKNLILTPGIYDLAAPIRVTRRTADGRVGYGVCNTTPGEGHGGDDDSRCGWDRDCGLTFRMRGQAESPQCCCMWGLRGPGASFECPVITQDPIVLHDVFFRVGGAAVGRAKVESKDQ